MRANEILHIDFPKESSFQELLHHLDDINGMLQTLLMTLEITLKIPEIRDTAPNGIPV